MHRIKKHRAWEAIEKYLKNECLFQKRVAEEAQLSAESAAATEAPPIEAQPSPAKIPRISSV